MIRTAIIGISGYGRQHLELALEGIGMGRVKLVAAVVINQEAERQRCDELRKLGCVIYDDIDAMMSQLSGQLDLCLIPTGISHHLPMTLAALDAGANVLVEKPLTATLAHCDTLIEAELLREKQFVAVGFQDVYADTALALKSQLDAGIIGKPMQVEVACLWPRPDSYYSRNNWAGRVRTEHGWVLDSPINNAMAHYLMLPLWLLGANIEEAAGVSQIEAELYRARDIESFDTFSLRAYTRNGVTIGFRGSHCSRGNFGPCILIKGSRGFIRWQAEGSVEINASGTTTVLPLPSGMEIRRQMFDKVLKRIEDGEGLVCTPLVARQHTAVVNALHQITDIKTLPSDCFTMEEMNGGAFRVIHSLDEITRVSFSEGKLFSEMGVEWSVPAVKKDMSALKQLP